jgi:hypothetical protein
MLTPLYVTDFVVVVYCYKRVYVFSYRVLYSAGFLPSWIYGMYGE